MKLILARIIAMTLWFIWLLAMEQIGIVLTHDQSRTAKRTAAILIFIGGSLIGYGIWRCMDFFA